MTARDAALLATLWSVRELTGRQVQRLLFANLSDTVYQRRLTLLTRNAFLHARPLPFGVEVGSCPFRYTLGLASAEVLSPLLRVSRKSLWFRIRRDQRLLPSLHRQSITDIYVAYRRSSEALGYAFAWKSDDDLVRANQSVQVNGARVPIRADAFLTIDIPGTGKTAAFLEFQNVSSPKEYRAKVAAYRAYFDSGAYAAWSDFKSPFRVLGVTETATRASNLRDAANAVAGACSDLYWSTHLRRVVTDPFGPIWLVAGGDARQHSFINPQITSPAAP